MSIPATENFTNCNPCYTDKNIMTDAICTQKFITGGYNNSANECAHPNIKNVMMDILNEEQCILHDVFDEMSCRGWYPTEEAPQAKVNEVKCSFTGANQQ